MSRPSDSTRTTHATQEIPFAAYAGWAMFVAIFLLYSAGTGGVYLAARALVEAQQTSAPATGAGWGLAASILVIIATTVLTPGFFIVNPNESRVLILFGRYRGSVRHNGFFWTNPFTVKKQVSLRARNHPGETIKVNDKNGNPIEIAAVVVWRVRNTAQALFDVDSYVEYVNVQGESAVRAMASTHPYDAPTEEIVSLRGSSTAVAAELTRELEERLAKAGIEVLEARLTHLAYAPEIAGAMLQRQQADAVIAARQKIVDGAVGMVELALAKLTRDGIVELDEERKATMVSNLLVVLCSERGTQPIVNTGTLYT